MNSLLTMPEYVTIAEKFLSKRSLPIDDEAISYIVYYMVKADSRWDGRGSKPAFRGQYAWYGLTKWLRKRNKSRPKCISLDNKLHHQAMSSMQDNCFAHTVTPPQTDFVQDIMNRDIIDFIRNADRISDKNKDILFAYYLEGYTLEELGYRYNVTRERIRQILEKTLEKVRTLINVEKD